MAVENTQKFRRRMYLQNAKHEHVESGEEHLMAGDEEHCLAFYNRTVKIFEGYTSGYTILNDVGRTNVVYVFYRSSAHVSPSYVTLKDDLS